MPLGAVNGLAMACALVLAMAAAAVPPGAPREAARKATADPRLRVVRLSDGREALLDAGDHPVPRAAYRRIVSGSTVADELLLALCEPDRIAGFTVYNAEHGWQRHRFAGKPAHAGVANVEAILTLQPDLVVTHRVGDARAIARLRERGIAVFDLGAMRGMSTLPNDALELAWLLGDEERGRRFAASLERRMGAVARGLPRERRKRAVYVGAYGDKLYGGTLGTSYHDVLTAAGLIDVAAVRYRDWPSYTPEELLALDPDLLVTSTGMGRTICGRAGLDRLRACAAPGGVVELDPQLNASAGPSMLDAAEQIFARVYGTGSEPEQEATR